MVWFAYIIKYLPQEIQLTSVFSRKYNKKDRKKEKKKKISSLWWELIEFTLFVGKAGVLQSMALQSQTWLSDWKQQHSLNFPP